MAARFKKSPRMLAKGTNCLPVIESWLKLCKLTLINYKLKSLHFFTYMYIKRSRIPKHHFRDQFAELTRMIIILTFGARI